MAPHIFTQVFTVLRTVDRTSDKGDREVVALPFVYELLSSKEAHQYASVLQAIVSAATYGIRNCQPEMIMSNFELAIITACKEVFPHVAISACFFHLSQSLYRKIQKEWLQVAYNDVDNRTIKDFTHMLAALSFVPISDVVCYFARLKEIAPPEMKGYVDYFDATYVNGIVRRGRRSGATKISHSYLESVWIEMQTRLRRIVLNYETYKILDYLQAVGQIIVTSN